MIILDTNIIIELFKGNIKIKNFLKLLIILILENFIIKFYKKRIAYEN